MLLPQMMFCMFTKFMKQNIDGIQDGIQVNNSLFRKMLNVYKEFIEDTNGFFAINLFGGFGTFFLVAGTVSDVFLNMCEM